MTQQYLDYINMTKKQSEAAFREYLDERGPALERLREALAADGQDPDALLDGSVESLVPLWRWFLAHLTVFDAPAAPLIRTASRGKCGRPGRGTSMR